MPYYSHKVISNSLNISVNNAPVFISKFKLFNFLIFHLIYNSFPKRFPIFDHLFYHNLIIFYHMNILTFGLTSKLSLSNLTTSIYFMASKMQASSTQKTKDSAGRRLGYLSYNIVSKFQEINKYIQTISSQDKEDSNGNQEIMLLLEKIKLSMQKSKEQ